MRGLAKHLGLEVGSHVQEAIHLSEKPYAETMNREFSQLLNNKVNMRFVSPAEGVYDFSVPDIMVDFAAAHGMTCRGHAFVNQDHQLPRWLKNKKNVSREEALAILKDYITTTIEHYNERHPGIFKTWHISNEIIDGKNPDQRRETWWQQHVGDDVVERAIEFARAVAGPDVKLIMTDYGCEGVNKRSDAYYDMIQDMLSRGITIDGFGTQAHFIKTVESKAMPESIRENIRRFAALGVDFQITEIDVRLKLPPSKDDYHAQAKTYETLLDIFLTEPGCKAFLSWGFTDMSSWIFEKYPGWGDPLIFDANYEPKPAYHAMIKRLQQELPGDSSSPSQPTELSADYVGEAVHLSWEKANDPETGINHYVIFRNGEKLGTSFFPKYTDIDLKGDEKYTYTVAAVNNRGICSSFSKDITITAKAPTSGALAMDTFEYESSDRL